MKRDKILSLFLASVMVISIAAGIFMAGRKVVATMYDLPDPMIKKVVATMYDLPDPMAVRVRL